MACKASPTDHPACGIVRTLADKRLHSRPLQRDALEPEDIAALARLVDSQEDYLMMVAAVAVMFSGFFRFDDAAEIRVHEDLLVIKASHMEVDGNTHSTPTEKAKLTEQAKLTEKDITVLKYFGQIARLLHRLHDDACDRDTAGNRTLHYDGYCRLMLLSFFNPIVTSLRGLQQASELKNVQAKLGCARASLGSLSESTTVFDAERLKGIIGELG